jgi:transcription antitermination protein NusB
MTTGGTRRKSREMAMQMLFQGDMGKQTAEQVGKTFWLAREESDAETRGFAEDLYRVATVHAAEIDELIVRYAVNWRLERMPGVDRNVLRLAAAEMMGFKGTPFPIIINEALEIARRYSAPESVSFLNGVLDAMAKELVKRI